MEHKIKLEVEMGIMKGSAKYMGSEFRGTSYRAERAGAIKGSTAEVLSLKKIKVQIRTETMLQS